MAFGALLSALPALPYEVEEDLPITLEQFWWRARMENDVALHRLVEAVLWLRGTTNLVMARDGREPVYFVPLSRAEVQEPPFYPEYAEEEVSAEAADTVWERYFRYALETAGKNGSPLLAAMLRWEIGLRNALVARRAAALNLDPNEFMVLEEEGAPVEGYDLLLDRIDLGRGNPRAIQRALGDLRLEWLDEEGPWAASNREAVVAYALRLLVLKDTSTFIAKERAE